MIVIDNGKKVNPETDEKAPDMMQLQREIGAELQASLRDKLATLDDHYDYLVVGAGLFGSTFARLATDAGKKCLMVEWCDHVGGALYSEQIDGITVHVYGAHIFQPKSQEVWDFLKQHAAWRQYEYGYVPVGGYNPLFDSLLKDIPVLTGVSYEEVSKYCPQIVERADKIIYTGAIDEFFSYAYGRLGYSSIDIKIEAYDKEYRQDKAILSRSTYPVVTRSVEFKHLLDEKSDKTVLSWESAYDNWDARLLPCRPLNTYEDGLRYERYKELAERLPHIVFGGRFGSYQNYDMYETVSEAMKLAKKELKR